MIDRTIKLSFMARLAKDTTTIASKISRTDKQKLHAIADNLGLTFYGLVQAILLMVVRYWDKSDSLSAEHRNMIEAFAIILKSTIGSFNPISARNREMDNIKSAIYLVERKAGQRPQLLGVSRNEAGNMVESYNYDTMLSAFLGAIDPKALHCLEDEAKLLGHFSITQTLHELILQRTTPKTDIISMEINEMFNDVRTYTGQAINEDVRYKQTHRKHIEEYTTIVQKQTYRADL
jgi:hypothetical protein